jgi:hypothetical protein
MRATTTSEMRCFSWMETYAGDVAEASMGDAGAGGLDRGDLCEGSRASRTRFRETRRRGRARVHRVVEPAEPLADDLADDRRADVEVRRRLEDVAVRRRAGLRGRGGATSTLES